MSQLIGMSVRGMYQATALLHAKTQRVIGKLQVSEKSISKFRSRFPLRLQSTGSASAFHNVIEHCIGMGKFCSKSIRDRNQSQQIVSLNSAQALQPIGMHCEVRLASGRTAFVKRHPHHDHLRAEFKNGDEYSSCSYNSKVVLGPLPLASFICRYPNSAQERPDRPNRPNPRCPSTGVQARPANRLVEKKSGGSGYGYRGVFAKPGVHCLSINVRAAILSRPIDHSIPRWMCCGLLVPDHAAGCRSLFNTIRRIP
jgi:hypothetical protein